MERFISFLKGGTSEELSAVLVAATATRRSFGMGARQGREMDSRICTALECGFISDETCGTPLFVTRYVKHCQEQGDQYLACGYMVWLHVLRCYTAAELRLLGHAMWSELKRGYPQLTETIADHGIEDPVEFEEECRWVPYAMEIEES